VGFSLGIESYLIDGIAVSHAIVKHRFVDYHMLGGQFIKEIPFFIVSGIV